MLGDNSNKVVPKLVRKQNEWRYASLSEPLLSSQDMYDVKPATHADVGSARDNGLILNKQFNIDIERVNFIDEYVRTAVDEGTAFVRVGWEFEEDEVTREEPVMTQQLPPEIMQQLQQAQQAVQSGQLDPRQFQQIQQQAQQMVQMVPTGETKEVTTVETVYNRPTLEVCDYDKVMLDPTCLGDMDKAGFIVYQFTSSKGELREDPKYKNVDSIVTTSDDSIGDGENDPDNGSFNYRDDVRKRILVTEYWGEWDIDNDGTTVPIVATYCGSTMLRLEENPFPDKKPPFVKVNYLPKRRDVYGGEPDAVLIEDNQDVIGAVTRGMIDLMAKSANAQQGISADALDPAQKIRFEQGKDYVFNPGVDPSKAFFMGSYPEIPKSAMEMIQFQENSAESLTGTKSFSGGISGQALGATATGIRSAMDATAKRELGILRRLSFGMIQIGRKIMAMNAVNLDDEEIIRISDEEEVKINRNNLAGDFDIKLSISTPEVDAEQAQDLGFMLQTIGPSMDPGLQGIILGKIARLKNMPGLAKMVEEYKPQPDPLAEKQKQLQIALLEAELKNEIAKGTENEADTALKYAKASTEKAKGRALDSGSDMQDLEFVQEKEGIKHNRALDMEDRRLSGDLDRKGADSLLSQETSNRFENAQQNINNPPPNPVGRPPMVGMDTPQQNLEDNMIIPRL